MDAPGGKRGWWRWVPCATKHNLLIPLHGTRAALESLLCHLAIFLHLQQKKANGKVEAELCLTGTGVDCSSVTANHLRARFVAEEEVLQCAVLPATIVVWRFIQIG